MKYLKFISLIFSLLINFEFQRAWNIILRLILSKYFKAWHHVFGKYPKPIHADGIKQDPILVYQMAKVGSRSVLSSLELAYLKHWLPHVGIYHVHTLENLDLSEKIARERNAPPIEVIQEYKRIRREFDASPDQHWNIISLVRDPVGRNKAYFFQNIDHHIPDWRKRWSDKTLAVEEIVQIFLDTPEVHTAHSWFDAEFKPVLEVDVYATPFSPKNGYQVYSNPPKVDLLIIRLEDLNRVGERAIQDFLGIKDFSLHQTNIGDEKEYASIYNAFKSAPLPVPYVNEMYQTRFARHFYSDEELDGFMRKWTLPKGA
jgi:hypothetical protein